LRINFDAIWVTATAMAAINFKHRGRLTLIDM